MNEKEKKGLSLVKSLNAATSRQVHASNLYKLTYVSASYSPKLLSNEWAKTEKKQRGPISYFYTISTPYFFCCKYVFLLTLLPLFFYFHHVLQFPPPLSMRDSFHDFSVDGRNCRQFQTLWIVSSYTHLCEVKLNYIAGTVRDSTTETKNKMEEL